MTSSDIELFTVGAAADIPAADWDACAAGADASASAQPDNPFVSHAFMSSIEDSGAASRATGWLPQHLVARKDGCIVGLVPCYLKSHSQGEYVFDHAWADAFERAGGVYYPKLQAAVPFTPVTGPRLMVRREPEAARIRNTLVEGLIALRHTLEVSSVHVTFAERDEWETLGQAGFLQRTDRQFHWTNADYDSFEDFLGSLNARHRKSIRRERRDALAEGISIHWLTGKDITEDAWSAFYAFYMETGSRKWGHPYLNRWTFTLIDERMAERVVLIMAKRNGRWIAGAINFIGANTLYGRNWGAIEHHPFLHFEICYYQAIEFAIAHKLARVEAGAQGEHKLARGYLPVSTYSAHYIVHPGLRRAVSDYLTRERSHIAEEDNLLLSLAPFRHDGSGQS